MDDRGGAERDGDDTDARQVGHPARQNRGTDRVADDDDRDLRDRPDIGAADVEAHDRRDAEHAHEDAEPVGEREASGPAHEEGDSDAHERHGGDEQPRGRARELLLGRTQEVPRDDDFEQRVREHRLPAPQHDEHLLAVEREGQQEERREARTAEHDHRGVEFLDRDLDEEVRDAPRDTQREEQDDAAASHPSIVAYARLITDMQLVGCSSLVFVQLLSCTTQRKEAQS